MVEVGNKPNYFQLPLHCLLDVKCKRNLNEAEALYNKKNSFYLNPHGVAVMCLIYQLPILDLFTLNHGYIFFF